MLCNALAARIVNGFYAPTPAPFGNVDVLKFFKCDQERVADFLMEVYREDIEHYNLLYKARPRGEKNKTALIELMRKFDLEKAEEEK